MDNSVSYTVCKYDSSLLQQTANEPHITLLKNLHISGESCV